MGERIKVTANKPLSTKENSASNKQKTGFRSQSSHVDQILFLQRTIGNQAVQRLIKSGTLQAKLRIGQPGDKYEQEADRVADAVMRMPEPGVQRQVEPEEEELIQTKALAEQSTEVTPNLESRINAIKGVGQPLPVSSRDLFEPHFGYNFSQVQVHTDAEADNLNRTLNARAFTTGKDIFFRQGEHNPGSSSGRKLLAHELTHVVQQRAASHFGEVVQQNDRTEREIESDRRHQHEERGRDRRRWAGGDFEAELLAIQRRLPPGHRATASFDYLALSGQTRQPVTGSGLSISSMMVPRVQRDLHSDYSGQWVPAQTQLNVMYGSVGGVIDRQMGAVTDFLRYAEIPDQPSLAEQVLINGISIVLGAVIPGVGGIIKTAAQSMVCNSLSGAVGSIVDSMVDAGKGAVQGEVTSAWSQTGGGDIPIVKFAETQRRALENIAPMQLDSMNQGLARLLATEGENDEWEAGDALYRSFQQSLDRAHDEQFNKMTDTWFTMQTKGIQGGAVPGVLRITLERRYPDQGSFNVQSANLLESGSVSEIQKRLGRRTLRDISIPKFIQMNGEMGRGIMDCNWSITVTGEELRSKYNTISVPRTSLEKLTAVSQQVVKYSGNFCGYPWLAAFHLGIHDLDDDDSRNTNANRSAGAREVWGAIRDFTSGSIES